MPRVTVISGGVGAARFLRGLIRVVPPTEVTAVVNVGDDTVLHGLEISPDLDTVTYTLAGAIDPERGWGLTAETWQAMEQLRRYAAAAGVTAHDTVGNDAAGWFSLGDRDLGTHLYRTSRRRAGVALSEVTAEIARAWGLELTILPASDDPVRTVLTTGDGSELSFQEYFVREQHGVAVRSVRVDGTDTARPAPGVLESIESADVVVIAPSNPVVSIDPNPRATQTACRRDPRSARASRPAGAGLCDGTRIMQAHDERRACAERIGRRAARRASTRRLDRAASWGDSVGLGLHSD